MRLNVSDLPKRGSHIRFSLESPEASLVASALEASLSSLSGLVHVLRKGHDLHVTVEGHATATKPCERCGEPATFSADPEVTLHYKPNADLAEEQDLTSDDLDIGFFDGEVFDSDDAVSEAFALAAPERVICGRASCAQPASGPIASSGSPTGHPAFAALKDLI